MNSEFNNYNINNPDGASKNKYTERKISYKNDNPRFIKEESAVDEALNEVQEFGGTDYVQNASEDAPTCAGGNITDLSSVSSVSSVATVSSAVGGIGALAGTVAAAAVAAVIIVVAFVSTLTVNISLIMASADRMVFQLELSGVQEEDFVNPIIAVLEGDDGFYEEIEISPDTQYITFEELEPDKEYVITVKNEEKVFVKKSYFTATERMERGFMSVAADGEDVFIRISEIQLNSGEFYTVIVKDEKGNEVFAKDGVENDKEFSFRLSGQKMLYFTLSIGGTVYCFEQMECEIWTEDGSDYNP